MNEMKELRKIKRNNLMLAIQAEKDMERQRKILGTKPLKIGQIFKIEFNKK